VKLVIGGTQGGVRRYAEELRDGLATHSVSAEVVAQPGPPGSLNHYHLANSTREVLKWVALREAPSVLTVHDVLPRQRLLRAVLPRPQGRLAGRHHVIVHAGCTADLLRAHGFTGEATVIPMGAPELELDEHAVARLRQELSPDGRPIVTMAGVSKTAKGSLELLDAARANPELRFVFVGELADSRTRRAVAEAPSNVTHAGVPDDDGFMLHLAASDVLACFRREWLGEASLTVTQAHAVGTPVAGFRSGFLPEYVGEHDRLYDPCSTVGEALADLVSNGIPERLAEGAAPIAAWRDVAHAHVRVYERAAADLALGGRTLRQRGGPAA
jgi:glycosyltransferase involved in cell wall biosynthesis